ncbi:MAG: hypothetical protein O8C59_01690 [Candidatus Methanoperedens sp.]|nr:hypothetical protein [Candidatus Methanoperedens sp.]
MLEDLPEKFGKLKMPEGSLIKKLERIKKSTEVSYGRGSPTLFPDVIEQLRRAPEEITKKIEDMVNTKAEQIKSNTEAIKNIEAQFSKIDQLVSSGKKGTDEFKERLDKIDETVLELLSLYEVVSSTVNPFVGDKDNPISQKLSEIERKVEEFGQKKSEIPPNLLEEVDSKIKGLENTIEEIKKTVESKAIDENALAEKVTGLVVERIKPQARHRPGYAQPSKTQTPQHLAGAAQPATSAPQYIEEDESGIRLPYLDNRPETSIILLNWIEFLMEKVGRNNLFDVLEYYTEIGWISEEVSAKMMAYANGIDYYVERPTWKLLPEDHTKSLLFIEQLRGRKVDKNLFSRLERDVDKIIHSELLTQ